MNINDTIAAVATPDGYSALGMIRVSGDDVIETGRKVFRSKTGKDFKDNPRRPLLGFFLDPVKSTPLDTVLLTFFPSGSSYTGEEMLEISCHGNPLILERAVDILNSLGVRTAMPGEFTYRAYLNGKVDLSQAEGINRLAGALTLTEASSALSLAEGALGEKIKSWKKELVEMYSRLEGEIEFSGESGDSFFAPEEEKKRLSILLADLDEMLADYKFSAMMRAGVSVVITGRANSGKSTLFNLLLKSERSIVTDLPGTTRDVVSEMIEIEGLAVRLFDTAGIEEHEGETEKEGVRRARAHLREADLVILLLDSSRALTEGDREILDATGNMNRLIVLNKKDLKSKIGGSEITENVSRETLKISALKKTGIDALKKAFLRSLGWKQPADSSPVLLQSRRQKELLTRFKSSIESFLAELEKETGEEIATLYLRDALKPLDEITGQTEIEDVYNMIFSHFCVGK
jgi:tRNA modification GTPase